jgi:hypothetical protein
VLTFAQRVRRLPRRSSHPVPAFRRSRSGTLSAIHAHAHVQSHLNQRRRLSASASWMP